jgi:hypothetical protein
MPITSGNLLRVARQMEEYVEGFRDGAFRGLVEVGEAIYDRSQAYVPKDTTALQRSGRVNAELREADLAGVSITYGGEGSEAEAYAIKQHEEMSYFHKPPTSAKYLQRAVDEIMPEATAVIGEGAVTAALARAR